MSRPCWTFSWHPRNCPIPPCQPVNGRFYCEFLKRLREDIRHKHPDMWQNNLFLHDNMPTHTSLVVQFLTSRNIAVIPHPICLTSPPGTISHSTRWNYSWRGVVLIWRFAGSYRHISELPGTHGMGSTPGSLYTCSGGLLQRRRCKLGLTVRSFFFFNSHIHGSFVQHHAYLLIEQFIHWWCEKEES
jgi:hypothetical protein